MSDLTTIAMEQAVLGAVIEAPDKIGEVFDRIPPDEWTGPHQLIAATLAAMNEGQEPVTPVTLMERLRRSGLLIRVGGGAMIHTLVAANTSVYQLGFLTEALETVTIRRQGLAVATRLRQALENVTVDPEEVIHEIKSRLEQIGQIRTPVLTEGWPEADADPLPTWVIPGLLASDERLLLTGGEGLGKTMLIRQLLVSVAIGRHPFTLEAFEPGIVLHVDLENPVHLSDSGYRRIKNGLLRHHIDVPDMRWNGGVDNILDRKLHRVHPRLWDAENSRDVAWLMRLVRTLQPTLIAIGPLKNMSSENLNEEAAAVRVTNVLNRIRAESGAGLVVEAHAGHATRNTENGNWRPRGSASFMGWPEYGLALVPVRSDRPGLRRAELVRWRGPRVDRQWPEQLVEGDPWPWVEQPF